MDEINTVMEIPGFLSPKLCEQILEHLHDDAHSAHRQWNTVTFHNCSSDFMSGTRKSWWQDTEMHIERKILKALDEYHSQFNKCFSPSKYYLDGLSVIEYPEHSAAPMHLDYQFVAYDAEHDSIASGHCRDVGALVFLNDDFASGELIVDSYVEEVKVVKPEVGKLVILPFNFLYPHRTMMPIEGSRFMLRLGMFLRVRNATVAEGY